MGKILIILGVVLSLVGLTLMYAPDCLSWFGRLPGDIRIETESGFVFIPITSMVIVSVVLSAFSYLLSKF